MDTSGRHKQSGALFEEMRQVRSLELACCDHAIHRQSTPLHCPHPGQVVSQGNNQFARSAVAWRFAVSSIEAGRHHRPHPDMSFALGFR